MKEMYQLWNWPGGIIRGQEVGVFATTEDAIATTGVERADWVPSVGCPGGFHVPTSGDDRKFLYQSWAVSPIRVPETDADRIELAIELALENGQIDGAHHKMWVIDQMLRVLTGDRYEQVITEYCDGEDGPGTYSWDEGIAP